MKLPNVLPFKDNVLCRNCEEFVKVFQETLSKGAGAIFKVFGKIRGVPYYVTLLVDNEKILAVEAQEVNSGKEITDENAIMLLKELINGVSVVDAYPLDDIELKLSIADNVDIYFHTPKIDINEITGNLEEFHGITVISNVKPTIKTSSAEMELPKEKPKPKKKRMELKLNVPVEIDPYFRAMVNHLKNEAKLLGADFERVEVNAKEVRYALGAGTGIHADILIEARGQRLSPRMLKERLENKAYKEAAEISKELKKRVVISTINVRLL